MMRSLYSGVAGLKTHQTKMDVIGNNIANVNTTSYKSASVNFSDLLYQTTANASGANSDTGRAGINAKQIGLGTKMASITNSVTTAGATQSTGNPFDVKINGQAFFIVSDGKTNYFTRDGSFYVDGKGHLAMSSNGYNIMGWQTAKDADGNLYIQKDTVSALDIMNADNLTYPPEATSKAYVSGILDKNETDATTDTGKLVSLSIYDALGYTYNVKFAIKESDTKGTYTVSLYDITDQNGDTILIDMTSDTYKQGDTETDADYATRIREAIQEAADKVMDASSVPVGTTSNDTDTTFSLVFDTGTGKFSSLNSIANSASLNLALSTLSTVNTTLGDSFSDVEIDWSTVVWYNNGGASTIAATAGTEDTGAGCGRAIGNMSGVSISDNGEIYASYDNGMRKLLGQIAVAKFANASGLEKVGDNLYQKTLNSGDFDGIGVDITADGSGSFTTGALEMSNVDLSTEFTDMITTQRGFQANSRIITTSDTLLEELINLKR